MASLIRKNERIVSAKTINWLGLDFTRTKLIGSKGFPEPDKICNNLIKIQWNNLIYYEYEAKYNIRKALGNKEIIFYININNERNNKISAESLVIDHEYAISENEIPEIIKDYPLIKNDAINLAFIVESFNKMSLEARIWITFFDSHTNKLIYTEKTLGKPRGFGIRNYWAFSVYDVITRLETEYHLWSSTRNL